MYRREMGLAFCLCVYVGGGVSAERAAATQQPSNGAEARAPQQNENVLAVVGTLELMIRDLREELRGAVLAFDREDGCPAGWVPFEDAYGRFVVGIGRHTAQDVDGNEVTNLDLGEQGGERTRRLSVKEMPRHAHRVFVEPTRGDAAGRPWWIPSGEVAEVGAGGLAGGGSSVGRFMYGHGRPYADLSARILITEEGGSEPYDNMPPFVALKFCKHE